VRRRGSMALAAQFRFVVGAQVVLRAQGHSSAVRASSTGPKLGREHTGVMLLCQRTGRLVGAGFVTTRGRRIYQSTRSDRATQTRRELQQQFAHSEASGTTVRISRLGRRRGEGEGRQQLPETAVQQCNAQPPDGHVRPSRGGGDSQAWPLSSVLYATEASCWPCETGSYARSANATRNANSRRARRR
jgi:hypothetical protein